MNYLPDEKEELFSVRVVVLEKMYIDGSYRNRFGVIGIDAGVQIFFSYHDAMLHVVNESAKALLRHQ